MATDKEIYLVDGSGFLFRAYHAMGREPLRTSDGRATQAIFGVVNMLRALMEECQPTHIAVVMDATGKTFRHDLYPPYKANRPPMPPDLREQCAYLNKIIPAMGLPLLSVTGVEADDVIGTLAVQASASGFDCTIISSDKDLTQLVNAQVTMFDPMKKVQLDVAGVVEKFGVPPARMIEYLALVGDTSDNIPGVPKVGPKTARKWFEQYGTLDAIIENARDISGVVGENLRSHLNQLALSRQLTTIKCDVALDETPAALVLGEADVVALREYYTDLEFRMWLRTLDADNQIEPRAATAYETILDEKTLAKWLVKLQRAKLISIDTETTSLDAHRAQLVGLSFAVAAGEAAYLPLGHHYAGVPTQLPLQASLAQLRPLLEDPKKIKTGQNLKYDIEILHYHGINLMGGQYDTMLMSYLLNSGQARHDLDSLAKKYLNVSTIKFSDVAGKGKKQLTFDQVSIEVASEYAAEDADITLQLHHVLLPKLQENKKLYRLFMDIEIPMMMALVRTECNGVQIDAQLLKNQSNNLQQRLKQFEHQAYTVAGVEFNIASPKQIQNILYEKQGLPVLHKTPKGQPSTAENVLQHLAENYPLPRIILEHRSLAKLKSTYTDKLPELINPTSGRIHTSYHQAIASTGRLSSADPNLQNIPIRTDEGSKIREAFIPADGYRLLSADYSQIELRIMAHLSDDKGLIGAFNDGVDVHRATAAEVFNVTTEAVSNELRRRAKAINFGLIYGMSAFGLARQLKIDQKKASKYIEIYFDHYPGVKQYMEESKQRARDLGFVETLFGRRLYLADIHSKNATLRKYAERIAINAPMQGSAADLIKLAMVAIDRWINEHTSTSKIIMQVHDELVLEIEPKQVENMTTIARELMCGVAKLKIPLVVDVGVGDNWKEAH